MTDELKAKKAAMERATWISNVKRVLGYTDDEAEQAYDRITSTVRMFDRINESQKHMICKG